MKFNPNQQRAALKLVAMLDGGGRLRGQAATVDEGAICAAEILNCVDILMMSQDGVAPPACETGGRPRPYEGMCVFALRRIFWSLQFAIIPSLLARRRENTVQ